MADVIPAPRCCPTHASWTDLVQHLIAAFPQIDPAEVVDIVARARRAEAEFGLPEDEHLETAEVIARHQLLQLTSQGMPSPRLDPERHGRTHSPTPGSA
jgi:hypothetical protein